MESEQSRCGTCRFAAEVEGNVEKVRCHFNNPTTHLMNTPQGIGIMSPYPWPLMDVSADWCAHYEQGEPRHASRIMRLSAGAAAGLKAVK